jgi:hypothetical protein
MYEIFAVIDGRRARHLQRSDEHGREGQFNAAPLKQGDSSASGVMLWHSSLRAQGCSKQCMAEMLRSQTGKPEELGVVPQAAFDVLFVCKEFACCSAFPG